MQFSEMLSDLESRLATSSDSEFWTTSDLKEWLNKGQAKACNYKRWPALEIAKTTPSKTNQEYYDFPSEIKSGGIYKIEVDGQDYEKVSDFNDYLNYTGSKRVFGQFGRQYFLKPKPTEADLPIDVWGTRKPPKMVNDTDEPILTDDSQQETIIKLAKAVALKKAKKYSDAKQEEAEAFGLLDVVWTQQEEENKQGYVRQAQSSRWIS